MCAGSFSKFEFSRHLCAHGKRFRKHFRPGHPPFIPRPDVRVARSIREVKCAYVLFYSTHARLTQYTKCLYQVFASVILQPVVFIKPAIPESMEDKALFAKKIAKYGVSLKEYMKSLNEEEIVYVYLSVFNQEKTDLLLIEYLN